MEEPKTLQQAILYFADSDRCIAYLANSRWPDGVAVCPTCGRRDVSYVAKRRLWQCKSRHPKCQFSIKVGTIFEDSPISLSKWLAAMWMIANCKNGISSWEIHRALKVTQKTAWFMLHRIRLAMKDEPTEKIGLAAPVEIDESFVGGRIKNMHKSKRPKAQSAKGGKEKAIVLGMLERGGPVRTRVIVDRVKTTIDPLITAHVAEGARIITDEFQVYSHLSTQYIHDVINHAEAYVRGHIHTNGMENFWSLLKRGLNGTYVSVEPFHLSRYVEEQVFRYNNRATTDNPLNDADRFALVVSQIVGRRITYAELTGKTAARPF
ncbi:MAG: IS1595 family transposase [Terracidiphilus sp.]|jgi:transposase-like protein